MANQYADLISSRSPALRSTVAAASESVPLRVTFHATIATRAATHNDKTPKTTVARKG